MTRVCRKPTVEHKWGNMFPPLQKQAMRCPRTMQVMRLRNTNHDTYQTALPRILTEDVSRARWVAPYRAVLGEMRGNKKGCRTL